MQKNRTEYDQGLKMAKIREEYIHISQQFFQDWLTTEEFYLF